MSHSQGSPPAPSLSSGGGGGVGAGAEGARKVSVLIERSDFNESMERAIQSVLANQELVQDLHIQQAAFAPDVEHYPGWGRHLSELRAAHLEPHWHSELDPARLQTKALIRMLPDQQVEPSGFRALVEDMARPKGWLTMRRPDRFAVSSLTFIDAPAASMAVRSWFESLSYGFLLVLLAWDTLRSWVSLGRYHGGNTLRGELVTHTYPDRVSLAPNRWLMWWVGTGIAWPRYVGAGCMQIPPPDEQGLGFVLRSIKTHPGLQGWGLWRWVGFWVYYACCAWPWWNFALAYIPYVPSIMQREAYSTISLTIYAAHTAAVGYLAMQYMEFPYRMLPAQVVLYTFYLTASPALFLYASLHRSRAAWSAVAAKKQK